jgi:CRISPR-associated endonuclease/helicase Cas3
VLAVVNTRRDAAALAVALDVAAGATGNERTLHLSAAMCGQHRADAIDAIRARLAARRTGDPAPLRVVSTQLVEAGVDVDFPVVFRALAGLDSIAQAAGRCNREGRLGVRGGRVVVFGRPIPPVLSTLVRARQATVSVLGAQRPETLDPAQFTRYFEHWYAQFHLDERKIVDKLKATPDFDLQLRTAAESYRFIDDEDQVSIVVRYEPASRDTAARDAAFAALESGRAERWHLRTLQRYVVQARRRDAVRWLADGDLIEPMAGWFVLVDELRYDERFGLLSEGAPLDAATLAQ